MAAPSASRRAARRAAVVLLYQRDVTGLPIEELAENARRAGEPVDDPYARELIAAVVRDRTELDALVTAAATGWTADRLGALERNIIRVGAHEIRDPAGPGRAVAINEAVELAKRYCAAEAPAFVNGVLGRIAAEEGEG